MNGLRSDYSSQGSKNSICSFFLFLLFGEISSNQYFNYGSQILSLVYLNNFIQSIIQQKQIKKHHYQLSLLEQCKNFIKCQSLNEILLIWLIDTFLNVFQNKSIFTIQHFQSIQSDLQLMDQSQNFLFFSVEEESFHFFSGISSDIHSYGQFRLNMEIDDEAPNIGIGREGIILNEEAHLQPQVVDGLGCQDGGRIEQAKRASNTIFKTTLSQYRKSIIDSVKGSKAAWILEQIKKIYHQKNMSIFPKLLGIVRQLSLSEEVTARWTLRSQNLTAKKKELFNRGKYSKKRLDELEKSIESMNFSLREPFFEEGLQKYWGNYKQMGKYSKSKEEVVNYLNSFKALLNENSPQAEIQHDEPSSLRKCSSSSEASSQRISSFDP